MKQNCLSTRAETVRARITEALGIAALTVFILIFIYLSVAALIGTVDMNLHNAASENVVFMQDSLPLNLLWLLLFTACLVGAAWLLRRVSIRALTGITVAVVFLLGVIWAVTALSTPTNDSYMVSEAAYAASKGNYESVTSDYFRRFPFQLGYVFFSEVFFRLVGLGLKCLPIQLSAEMEFGGCCLFIEIVNVAFLALTCFALLRLAKLTFKRDGAVRITALLMMTCLQPILFCTFTYGNIPGIGFGVLGFLALAKLFSEPDPSHTRKKQITLTVLRAVACAVCLGLSASIKLNCAILTVAAVILLVLRIIRRPAPRESWKATLTIVLSLLCVWGIPAGMQKMYEKRAGFSFGDGIPMVSWAAMGLNEGRIAPGWYSVEYTVLNFQQNDYDPVRAGEVSGRIVRERLDYFKEHPDYAASFFDKKLRSQWNEPSYQSIWTNQVRGEHFGKKFPASWVCGDGEAAVKGFMNIYQQAVFVLALAAAVLFIFDTFKRKPGTDALLLEGLLLPMTVIGGFLYHAVCEAKSQYSLVYLILLLPLAAYAADRLYEHIFEFAIPKLTARRKKKQA